MATTTTLPADKFDTSTTFVRPEPAPTRAPLDKLAVLPGFNTRVKDADYNERVDGIAESIAAHGFFDDKPFAVVMLEGDDTIYIYDGEHRFDGAKRALLDGAEFPDGLPIAFAKDGATVKDITIHLAHGNNGERLGMVELAAVVRRMQGLDMTKDEIAAALGRTTRHVDNLFVLAAANQTVKKAVASGKIAGAEAVKLLRKNPATAGAKIAEAVKKAEEAGKAKATPKSMATAAAKPSGPKTKTIPMSMNFPAGKTVGDCLKSMAKEIREFVEFDKGTDVVQADALVRFSITVIDRVAEAEAAQRAVDKAEAAKKRESEKAAAEKAKAAKKALDEKEKAAKIAAQTKAVKAAIETTATKAAAKPKPATAPKKGTTAKPKATGGKAATGAKAVRDALKPAEADSGTPANQAALEAGSTDGGTVPAAEDGNAGL